MNEAPPTRAVDPWWRRDIGRPRWGPYLALWLSYPVAGGLALFIWPPLTVLVWGCWCGGVVLFWKPGGTEPTSPHRLPWRRAVVCAALAMSPLILFWALVH